MSETPDEVLWAMDICTEINHPYYGNPIAAHQIVREEDGGKVRITACGKRLTKSNHPGGWWSSPPGKLPLAAHAVHCMAVTDDEETEMTIDGQTSDGYHTFDELYRFRMLYNAALFNEWADPYTEFTHGIHKSWRHYDGELCFGGGWFIVMVTLPTGQISNHYEAKDWDFFQIPERERADEWDGHTASDVAVRLEKFLQPSLRSTS